MEIKDESFTMERSRAKLEQRLSQSKYDSQQLSKAAEKVRAQFANFTSGREVLESKEDMALFANSQKMEKVSSAIRDKLRELSDQQ